jgi:hypothetical protein
MAIDRVFFPSLTGSCQINVHLTCTWCPWSRDGAFRIATGLRTGRSRNRVQIAGRGYRDFSCPKHADGSGLHQALYSVGTARHSSPSSAYVKNFPKCLCVIHSDNCTYLFGISCSDRYTFVLTEQAACVFRICFQYLIRIIWKVLKCGAGGEWRRSVGPIV